MVKQRNCAWSQKPAANNRVVWTRKKVFTQQCPKSMISSQSLMFIEQFRYWKHLGGGVPWDIDSKAADALLLLEQLFKTEEHDGK